MFGQDTGGPFHVRHRQSQSVDSLVIDGRWVCRLGIKRRYPLEQAEAVSITSINGHIGTPITHGLIKAPGRRFVSTERLLVDQAHFGVTKLFVKRYGVIHVADVDTDIRHAHDVRCVLGR